MDRDAGSVAPLLPARGSGDAAGLEQLALAIKERGRALGFSQIGIGGVDLGEAAERGLIDWLAAGHHGEMHYMQRHGLRRARPAELLPGTLRVVSAQMDYLPRDVPEQWRELEQQRLVQPGEAIVSLYARGRDYHKVLRSRLQQLADFIAARADPGVVRVFTDSAPVMEVALAERAGIGWRGKHTLLLDRSGGSMVFLGEIFVGLPLPVDAPVAAHCGSCARCLAVCPTQAIVAPYRLDARRCISYLTIEHPGSIPVELRPLIGNRIYGCDDCQLVCPWNRFARRTTLPDFEPRHGLDCAGLLELWGWDESEFLSRTEGSAIRRIGYSRWRRNLAVALGNGLRDCDDPRWRAAAAAALQGALPGADALAREHIAWALAQSAAGCAPAAR